MRACARRPSHDDLICSANNRDHRLPETPDATQKGPIVTTPQGGPIAHPNLAGRDYPTASGCSTRVYLGYVASSRAHRDPRYEFERLDAQMLRARFVVPVLTFAVSAMAAVAPSVTTALADSAAVALHDTGDMSAWGYGPTTTTISVGQTVMFTNTGSSPHDATAADSSWATPLLQSGQSAPVTFTTPGTFAYTCLLHPWMKGTIVVTPAASAPVPAPAPAVSDAPAPADTTISAPPAPVQVDTAPAQPADSGDATGG